MLRILRNPLPRGGAVVVSNPKKERIDVPDGVVYRANPLEVRSNPLEIRSNPLEIRSNPMSIRSNPLAIKRNAGEASAAQSKGLAGIPGRLIEGGDRLLTKGLGMAQKVPVLGMVVAKASPAVYGGLAILPHKLVLKYAGQYLPAVARPVAYSLVGLVASLALELLPTFGAKAAIQRALVFAGGVVDSYRFFGNASQNLGEGNYTISSYGDDFGDVDGADIGEIEGLAEADISDADIGNFADTCGFYDFSDAEIAALGAPPRFKKMLKEKKKDHREEGHRLMWLVKLVGYKQTKELAKLPEAERQKVIHELKQHAHAVVGRALKQGGGHMGTRRGSVGPDRNNDNRPDPVLIGQELPDKDGINMEGLNLEGEDLGATMHGGDAPLAGAM